MIDGYESAAQWTGSQWRFKRRTPGGLATLGWHYVAPVATPEEAGRHNALMERLRTPCGELIALYDNGLIVSDGTVPKVIEEIRAALIAKENPDG
jgi:hypothetical protein